MARRKTHPGSIDMLPSGSFRVRLSVGGQSHAFILEGVTQWDAEQYAREKHRELGREAKRTARGLPGRILFSDLIERFTASELPSLSPGTRKSYGSSFRAFKRYFVEARGNPEVQEFRPGHIKEFMTWRRTHREGTGRGPVSHHTVAKDRRVLHRLFHYAMTMEVVDGNPVAAVESPKGDARNPVLLTEPEIEGLLANLVEHPMAWLYIMLLAESGLRAYSEALHLQWADIDFKGQFIHVRSGRDGHRTKTGRSRWVPMTTRLRQALQDHASEFRLALYDDQRSPWVFHHLFGARAGQRVKEFRGAVDSASKKATIPSDWRLHDLRHRRVTTWLGEGHSPVLVKEAMGHASLQTTMGYTHLAKEHLRALVSDPRTRLRELGT